MVRGLIQARPPGQPPTFGGSNNSCPVATLSPSTRRVDVSLKLAGYFRLPSVMHYLIVDPTQPSILHHARGERDTIITRVVTAGSIALDPPGIELAMADIYGA